MAEEGGKHLFDRYSLLRVLRDANSLEVDCAICLWLGLNGSLTNVETTSDRLLSSLADFLLGLRRGTDIADSAKVAAITFLINEVLAAIRGNQGGKYTKAHCNEIIVQAFGIGKGVVPFK